jgi:hypothetical protein
MFYARATVRGVPCAFIGIPLVGLQALTGGPNLAVLDGWNGAPLELEGVRVLSVLRADTFDGFLAHLREIGAENVRGHQPKAGRMDALPS